MAAIDSAYTKQGMRFDLLTHASFVSELR